MTTRTLYPKGDTTDRDRLIAAINGGTVGAETWTSLADDDTLLLKSYLEGGDPITDHKDWVWPGGQAAQTVGTGTGAVGQTFTAILSIPQGYILGPTAFGTVAYGIIRVVGNGTGNVGEKPAFGTIAASTWSVNRTSGAISFKATVTAGVSVAVEYFWIKAAISDGDGGWMWTGETGWVTTTKRISIIGDINDDGTPKTKLVHQAGGGHASCVIRSPGFWFKAAGDLTKYVNIKNIVSGQFGLSVYTFHGLYTIENCTNTKGRVMLVTATPLAATYPHYSPATPYDFSDMRECSIKNCKTTDSYLSFLISNSGVVIEDCQVGPWDTYNYSYQLNLPVNGPYTPNNPVYIGPFSSNRPSWYGPTIAQSNLLVRDVVIRNNLFTNKKLNGSFGTGLYQNYLGWGIMIDCYIANGVTEKVEIYGNTFDSVKSRGNGTFALVGIYDELANITSRDISICDNAFVDVGGTCIQAVSLTGTVDNVIISGNTFDSVLTQNVPAPIAGSTAVPPIYLGHVTSAGQIRNCSVVKNDFKDSGYLPLSEFDGVFGAAMVGLDDGTAYNTVFEAGCYPPGFGGAGNFIVNLGTQNRIVGERANMMEKPAGIGQVIKGISQQCSLDRDANDSEDYK